MDDKKLPEKSGKNPDSVPWIVHEGTVSRYEIRIQKAEQRYENGPLDLQVRNSVR